MWHIQVLQDCTVTFDTKMNPFPQSSIIQTNRQQTGKQKHFWNYFFFTKFLLQNKTQKETQTNKQKLAVTDFFKKKCATQTERKTGSSKDKCNNISIINWWRSMQIVKLVFLNLFSQEKKIKWKFQWKSNFNWSNFFPKKKHFHFS